MPVTLTGCKPNTLSTLAVTPATALTQRSEPPNKCVVWVFVLVSDITYFTLSTRTRTKEENGMLRSSEQFNLLECRATPAHSPMILTNTRFLRRPSNSP